MLLDSNILIYGADGGEPRLDAILDCTDLAIASVIRIEHGLTLVTRNVDDFKHVAGLDLINPFADPESA